jgi:uncharacterized protein
MTHLRPDGDAAADTRAGRQSGDGRPWLRSTPVRLLVFFVLLTAVDVAGQLAGKSLRAGSSSPWAGVSSIAAAVALSAVMIIAYRLLVRWIERRAAQELGREHAVQFALTGAACGAALFAAVYLVLAWMGVAHIGGYAGTGNLAHAAGVALGSAVGEEIVFRGAVFRIMEEGLGTLAALAGSATLFGLLHGLNPGASVVSTTAITLEAGVLLAVAYAATRSLWLPIGLHFGWNFTEGGVFGAAVSGNAAHGVFSSTLTGDPRWTGGAFGPEASLAAVGVCLIASLALVVIAIRRHNWQPLRLRLWVDGDPVTATASPP